MPEPHTYSPDPCPACGEDGCCDPNYGGPKPCDTEGTTAMTIEEAAKRLRQCQTRKLTDVYDADADDANHYWDCDATRIVEAYLAVQDAIRDYHFALDSREHGGVAQDKAIHEIERILGIPWQQGEEKKRRLTLGEQ